MPLASVYFQRGLRSAQPAATAVNIGTLYFVTDESVTERSTGSAWETFSDGGQALGATSTPQFARVGIGAAADANSKLKIVGDYWSPTVAAGNSGTSKTLDWRDGNTQLLTLTDNCTLTLSNPQNGARYLIALKQDGVGSRTVTWPSSVKWPAGAAPTLTTGVGLVDVVTLVYFAGLGASGNYIAASTLNFTPA